ncbi:Relaxase [hydrothermal vent metagenome]|uniref:Relaxase n=1 Tax=hydrothermal vent metagenome TaxID=652676 RepID=A0A1W1BPY0_9ZZZZ
MIIQIKGSSNRGWRKYVTKGTDKKPRDPSKVKILKGDLIQGDRVVNLTNYKENSYLIVLSFKGKVKEETVRAVLDEFEQHFMMGFDKDEYHLDAVWHRDTDDDHVHIRIPKINLRTQTQLQLYFDKKDRKRINAIRDYLDVKYELESPLDNKSLIKEDRDFYIDNWRKEFGDMPFSFTDKKSRVKVEQFITQSVLELHQAELLDSFEDMKNFIEEQGVKVSKAGYDKPKDFHYLTIENESGKMRIKGEIYNEEFWCNSRQNREEQISSNKRDSPVGGEDESGLDELKGKLENYNNKRKREIDKQYKPARQRAEKRAEERERKHTEQRQIIRKDRTPLFTFEPYPIDYLSLSYKFHPVPVPRKRLGNTKDVSSRAERHTFRFDTQDRFIRDQGRKISLFHTKGEKLNERAIRRRLKQIRDERSLIAEREKHLLEQIKITNNKLPKSIRTAEQGAYTEFEESRATMEADIAENAKRFDRKIEQSDTKNRSVAGRIRELLDGLHEHLAEFKKSIKGAINEIKKMKLFKKASEQVSIERPTIKRTPWS